MAEKCCARKHTGKALEEVGKARQALHNIRRKVQHMEAKSAHDVIEEVRKGGQSPQKKKSMKNGYRFGPPLLQSTGMTCVAGFPAVSVPYKGLK